MGMVWSVAPRLLGSIVAAAASACTGPTPQVDGEDRSHGPDHVAGSLVMLSDNGGWSWFQDERAIVDVHGQRLVVSSVANRLGLGSERDAAIDVTTFELATGRRTRAALARLPTHSAGDDHNAAALWQRPDGRYLAMYTGHLHQVRGVPQSFYRVTTDRSDGSRWEPEGTLTWPANDTTPPIHDDVTYSNLLWLAHEGRLYDIARASDRSPSLAVSDDWGESWAYAGRLSATGAVGQQGQYSNGYFKFSSNGVDRFDFIATEHHPHNYNTSIYHGYVQGGRSYDAHGHLVDADVLDDEAPPPDAFTPVWVASEVTPTSYHHAWTVDLERADDGHLHALFTTRHGTTMADSQPGDGDHRLFYARLHGKAWHVSEVARMGGPLYPRERDYTGLGAIHPSDPRRIYVSTPIDPRSGVSTSHHEIYEGVTDDGGASWAWTPITAQSTVDNLRPIVPSWDADHTAVLWLRGSYRHQRRYDLSVVGVIDRRCDESTSRITYVDADPSNTMPHDGARLEPTLGTSRGSADDRWHQRVGFGNGDDVLASNERDHEDAPRLRTVLTGLAPGTYDVFVFHWANPTEDWRIQAGFSAWEMLTFRRATSQLVVAAHLENGDEVTTVGDTVRLYRAYVGRVGVPAAGTLALLVDDVGGGSFERTWYDGLGYARVSSTDDAPHE